MHRCGAASCAGAIEQQPLWGRQAEQLQTGGLGLYTQGVVVGDVRREVVFVSHQAQGFGKGGICHEFMSY